MFTLFFFLSLFWVGIYDHWNFFFFFFFYETTGIQKNMFSFLFKNHGYSAVFTGVFNSVWIQFYLLSLGTKLTNLFLIGIFFERQFELWIIDALRWKGIIRKRACYKHDILMKVVNISALVTFFFSKPSLMHCKSLVCFAAIF